MDGFSQPHVVSKDSVDSAFVKRNHPVESNELIILELTALQSGRLTLETSEIWFVNFLILGLEVTSFAGFLSGGILGGVFREKVIGVELSLFNKGFDGLRGGGIFGRFKLLEFEKDFLLDGAGLEDFFGFLFAHWKIDYKEGN